MKRLLIIISLLFVATIIINNKLFGQVSDVFGWGKTKWGMHKSDIIKVYPDAKRINKRELKLKHIDIAADKYDVQFIMNMADELKEVIIYPERNAIISEGRYVQLEKLLVEKYGRPAYHDKRDTFMGYDIDTVWKFPSTTIELAYSDFVKIGKQLLKIDYKKHEESPNL